MLFRSWVTGGATIELELALAEKAGLRGGYSTPETLLNRDRFKVEQMKLISSPFRQGQKQDVWSWISFGISYLFCRRIVEDNYLFGNLFAEAASKYGMLCIGIYRYG